MEHVAVALHPETSANVDFLRAAETAAVPLGIKVTSLGVHNASEIERAVAQFAQASRAGLIVAPHPVLKERLIVDLAAHHRVPAIYPFAYYAKDGGLVSYGIRSARPMAKRGHVCRSHPSWCKTRGLAGPAADQVQLVINLKTAKALGLAVPTSLLARADEVIE